MKDFNINVRVQIGITDALYGLLSAFAKNLAASVAVQVPAPVETIPAPETPATGEQPQDGVSNRIDAPEPAPVEEAEKELTLVDVRAAIDRTRRRIEGENYKEDTDSESYQKWHRVLTGWFKSTAAIYGADLPSLLPDHVSRKGFIADCDAVHVENNELTTTLPF